MKFFISGLMLGAIIALVIGGFLVVRALLRFGKRLIDVIW
jgi:hypothetical protein